MSSWRARLSGDWEVGDVGTLTGIGAKLNPWGVIHCPATHLLRVKAIEEYELQGVMTPCLRAVCETCPKADEFLYHIPVDGLAPIP
jgi:hypothetical protein